MKADLVHVYSQTAVRGAYLGPCRFAKRPLVITTYEMQVPEVLLGEPPLIVGTRYQFEELADRPGPVHLISPPVDTESDSRAAIPDTSQFRDRLGVGAGEILLVWVGRLSSTMKQPAVESLIRAVELIGRDDVTAVIVGTGDVADELERLGEEVNRRTGRRSVQFTGSLADPREAYAAADIGIGMGSSAGRALSFGSPLVAVGEAGWSRRFDQESALDLFRSSFWSSEHVPDGPGRLVSELEPLIEDAGLRRDLGAYGRRFAEEHFGLAAMARKQAAIYKAAADDYRFAAWARDLDLEALALRELALRRVLRRPARVGAGEYRFAPRDVARLRTLKQGAAAAEAVMGAAGGARRE